MSKKNIFPDGYSIVIPNYNGTILLRKNLPSVISALKNKTNLINEIIIVDDHSKDNSVMVIKKEFPEVKLIRHRENRGFSSAVNTGARTARSEFIVLLNTDVKPAIDFLKHIGKTFQDKNVFAVSLHEKGYGWAKGSFQDGFIVHEPGMESQKIQLSFWASGGSAVFRREMWMKLKGMDEELYSPFYWEDVDLSYRAQKRGWLIYWEPKALVEHKHESTISRINESYRSRIQERNHLLFQWKNITSPPLFRKHIRGLIRRVLRHPGYIRIVIMSLKKLTAVIEKRKIEKKEATVADEAILSRF